MLAFDSQMLVQCAWPRSGQERPDTQTAKWPCSCLRSHHDLTDFQSGGKSPVWLPQIKLAMGQFWALGIGKLLHPYGFGMEQLLNMSLKKLVMFF